MGSNCTIKAYLAEFLLYMVKVENEIAELFAREFGVSDAAASLVLKQIQSVSRRFELIVQLSKDRDDPNEFLSLVKRLKSQFDLLKDIRNAYAHTFSEDVLDGDLTYKDPKRGYSKMTIETLTQAHHLAQDLALLNLDAEQLEIVINVGKDTKERRTIPNFRKLQRPVRNQAASD